MGIAGRFFMLLSPISLIRLSRRGLQIPLHYHRLGFHPRSLGPSIRPKASPFPPLNPSHHQVQRCHLHTQSANSASTWPEFSSLLNNLSAAGYFKSDLCSNPEEFSPAAAQLPEDFLRAATACLAFARDKAQSLGLLSRNDIEVLVQNGMPFLFQNAEQSSRRMRLYLESGGNNVSEADKADMVDLMKFVLSYACNIVAFTEISNPSENVVVQSSVRNLLSELGKLHFSPLPSNPSVPVQTPFSHKYGQTQRPLGQNIEMKRGDWICARCNFMNFARNVKCLECEEARPKRQLNGGEWECPQCDFYNYARNTVCLRCDCNRPGGISLSSGSTTHVQRGLTYGTGSMTDKVGMDSILAANNEKAQRWFSKVSQLDSTSDMSSVVADEDFPEIMPLRKGINRFVVSTRKTPLERRLANAEHQRSMRNDGNPNSLRTEGANETQNISTDDYSIASNAGGRMEAISGNEYSKPSNQLSGYERVDGVTEPTSSVSDDDFPETMPMRKGENKFVISRKTHRSLASPMYQKRVAMEQADDKNHIPFVPFPPDYFAKKETDLSFEANDGNSTQNDIHTQANSLEGSAVKEPDLLDMSEEAKAERWFKRVAQIEDISELSQIPDEDFPSIMPMRKGVNRFVVSKRKTPFERRLTSQKYRTDLPDPMTTNKEGNNS